MADKNKDAEKSKEKLEQHKKSTDTTKVRSDSSEDPDKNVQKTGKKLDDWNDPTGNTHLSDKS